jgi:SpoIID/LytB domain protein
MGERRGALRAAAALAVGLLLTAAPAARAVDDTPVTELRVDGPLRIEGGDGAVLLVDGDTRYLDTLELRPSGTTLVNELSLEAYVLGVAEMPPRWPGAALEAQAIAARTYAWFSIRQDSFEGYDICATVACQVFRGAEQALDGGERWQAAVEATAGQVLVEDDGRPILARYFSTSGGRTYANEDVFPSTGARPYLVAIDDPYDEVSPYHRWTVRFSREEFDTILGRGDTLAAAVPVAAVERLGDVDDQAARIRVTGEDGTVVEVGAVAFRDFVSRIAPDAFDRFPTARRDGLRPLPATMPSSRYTIDVADEEVVVEGRGWGHGVGMGQYGARGRAEAGQSATDILATYYGGLVPTTTDELPGRIRVGLRDADALTVRGDRPVDLVGPDGAVLAEVLGTWSFTRDGGGFVARAPEGTEAALEVSTTREAGGAFGGATAVAVETDVNKPVVLRLEVRDAAGEAVVERDLGVADAGTHSAVWRWDGEGGRAPAGEYTLTLLATDAAGATAGAPVVVRVPEPGALAALTGEGPEGLAGALRAAVLLAALVLPLALLLLVFVLRRSRS